ncbi:MAG: biopolymer transporter ExbD [Bacteroidetes bacterium]|nr:biopolymer transporter ExbD [Bacteroidota bacterium]
MNFRKKNQILSNFNAAPMNDIIFFLLLFFLLTSSFAIPTYLKVALAKAEGETVVKQTIAITITSDNKYFIEQNEIPADQIVNKIVALTEGKENVIINLRNDKACNWEAIARVMNQANKMKAAVILATETTK